MLMNEIITLVNEDLQNKAQRERNTKVILWVFMLLIKNIRGKV